MMNTPQEGTVAQGKGNFGAGTLPQGENVTFKERPFNVTAGFYVKPIYLQSLKIDKYGDVFVFYPFGIQKSLRKLARMEMNFWERLIFLFNSRHLS